MEVGQGGAESSRRGRVVYRLRGLGGRRVGGTVEVEYGWSNHPLVFDFTEGGEDE